ncbi:MotA/TolQ/ExbB proton channel family protein [Pseudoruegeria sp. M32A2M]|nr:MotA/TolQ/ExbB proton channel family protein [Pseudoruegeria sp. M32A2M]
MDMDNTQFGFSAREAAAGLGNLLDKGGIAIWVIAALSVVALALVFWKIWHFLRDGTFFGGRHTGEAALLWQRGEQDAALAMVEGRNSLRARLACAAMQALRDPKLGVAAAETETSRVARGLLSEARSGLRALELIATIAPLLGLLGTVLGMIAAFQSLQQAGSRADPAILAGGIWQALLTTAAGMAVAIVASVCLAWFESVLERLRHDMEDVATIIFLRAGSGATPPAEDRVEAAE